MNDSIFQHTGACPRCGAPIFASVEHPVLTARDSVAEYASPLTSKEPPTAHFTCDCRLTLAKPLPDVSELGPESTEDGDRKWLARNRKESEPPSAERAE